MIAYFRAEMQLNISFLNVVYRCNFHLLCLCFAFFVVMVGSCDLIRVTCSLILWYQGFVSVHLITAVESIAIQLCLLSLNNPGEAQTLIITSPIRTTVYAIQYRHNNHIIFVLPLCLDSGRHCPLYMMWGILIMRSSRVMRFWQVSFLLDCAKKGARCSVHFCRNNTMKKVVIVIFVVIMDEAKTS